MTKRLLVIIPDRLSELIAKGEVTARYYNPGNVFEEVHLLQTNDDVPSVSALQPMVGNASLHVHNLPAGLKSFVRSLGWRPRLLRRWAQPAVALAASIGPALVRCHGAHLNAYAAYQIQRELGIPYVVSLHINPDEDVRPRAVGLRERILTRAITSVETLTLRNANLVLPVYEPIVPFLRRIGVSRFEVVHNVVNPTHLRHKTDYNLHDPVRVLSVGRQFAAKDPTNVIRAVAQIAGVHLTLVGDGPYHDRLVAAAESFGLGDRVAFHRAMLNDELCRRLPEYDMLALHSEYWEISKVVLEALLTGLPVVLNNRKGLPVPELRDDIVVLVENSPEGYVAGLSRLLRDEAYRSTLGRRAYAYARQHWAPDQMEARVAALYRDLMAPAGA
jgi:glycosyltransferase involved in cell wall biosynthesis